MKPDYKVTDVKHFESNLRVEISDTKEAFRYRICQMDQEGEWVSYNHIAVLKTRAATFQACSEADAGFFLPKSWTPYEILEVGEKK